ncbi:CHASE2 domain-containing protein [Sodalinema gerasimenkoae]|uniref:CHASE2 domain-containing protein n=1 Tax=Sodalinema gerasimenkoae TaxID=2862348 RepID=UPI001359CF2E|nr:CHASE2 domain-containing protein [Sodalinema gerasimenkoae]
MAYRLSIHQIEQSCLFDLTWGKGQRLTATVAFPQLLLKLYQHWRRAYLGYYKQALRGRVGATGQLSGSPVDWHSQLVQAEARFLSEFHRWLKRGELFDLRSQLATPSNPGSDPGSDLGLTGSREGGSERGNPGNPHETLFLTCSPLDLARFPWETWEFGRHIEVVRSPPILSPTCAPNTLRRGRPRVLAILGDETGLNFKGERLALKAQRRCLDIHYVGWQPGEESRLLKDRICQAIADPQGWDVLFFAGHSNEAALLDGQVAIAPQTSLSIRDLSPYLRQAQQRGLQFALFNSCSGLDIAQALINLGLGQVAIMREPIHNEVAQEFLVQFLQRLSAGETVQTALRGAGEFLKLEKNLTYPSAYLVPSLFRHPESPPYRLPEQGWRGWWRRLRPTKSEAVAVGSLLLLSVLPNLHYWLLDQRVGMQARYRDWTGQVAWEEVPPVVLVLVDQQTFQRRGLSQYKPIDRQLLADVMSRVMETGVSVVGVDYLLDLQDPRGQDAALRQVLAEAFQRQVWSVLITARNPGGEWIELYPEVAQREWLLLGDAWVPFWHIRPRRDSPYQRTPFSYQLAIAHRLQQQQGLVLEGSREDQVQRFLRDGEGSGLSPWTEQHPLTLWSYRWHQRWLQPLLDFSLPPEAIYERVLAWQLLESPEEALAELRREDWSDAVVIIAAGGYYEAGIDRDGGDNLPPPPAIRYWQRRQGRRGTAFMGGEAHAYMTHHFLTSHLVIPIPDSWLLLVTVLGGKVVLVYGRDRWRGQSCYWGGVGAIALYGGVSLQVYSSAGLLLPWLFPALAIAFYSWNLSRFE